MDLEGVVFGPLKMCGVGAGHSHRLQIGFKCCLLLNKIPLYQIILCAWGELPPPPPARGGLGAA